MEVIQEMTYGSLFRSSRVLQLRNQKFGAALASTSQTYCGVVCALPEDDKKMSVVRMDREDFKGRGYVGI